MTDQEWLNTALASMHSGQWFGWKKNWTGDHRMSYENIIVHDSSITKPSEADVNAVPPLATGNVPVTLLAKFID